MTLTLTATGMWPDTIDYQYTGCHRRPVVSMVKVPNPCAHPWRNLSEVGMTEVCGYGCKIMQCKCGDQVTTHRAVYGCPLG